MTHSFAFQLDSNLEKDELVGKKLEDLATTSSASSVTTALQPSAATPAQSAASRPGQFGLGDRAERLLTREGLQAAILLPHAAAKNDAKVRPLFSLQSCKRRV